MTSTTLEKPSEPATNPSIEGMVLAADPELRAAQWEMATWPSVVYQVWEMEYLDLVDQNPEMDRWDAQLEAYRRVVGTPSYMKRKAG